MQNCNQPTNYKIAFRRIA